MRLQPIGGYHPIRAKFIRSFRRLTKKRSPFRVNRCVMPYGRSTLRSRILAWPDIGMARRPIRNLCHPLETGSLIGLRGLKAVTGDKHLSYAAALRFVGECGQQRTATPLPAQVLVDPKLREIRASLPAIASARRSNAPAVIADDKGKAARIVAPSHLPVVRLELILKRVDLCHCKIVFGPRFRSNLRPTRLVYSKKQHWIAPPLFVDLGPPRPAEAKPLIKADRLCVLFIDDSRQGRSRRKRHRVVYQCPANTAPMMRRVNEQGFHRRADDLHKGNLNAVLVQREPQWWIGLLVLHLVINRIAVGRREEVMGCIDCRAPDVDDAAAVGGTDAADGGDAASARASCIRIAQRRSPGNPAANSLRKTSCRRSSQSSGASAMKPKRGYIGSFHATPANVDSVMACRPFSRANAADCVTSARPIPLRCWPLRTDSSQMCSTSPAGCAARKSANDPSPASATQQAPSAISSRWRCGGILSPSAFHASSGMVRNGSPADC